MGDDVAQAKDPGTKAAAAATTAVEAVEAVEAAAEGSPAADAPAAAGPEDGGEEGQAGAVVLSKARITVVEGGACDFYSVRLSSAPRADVLVEINDPGKQVRTMPKVMRFSPSARENEVGHWNWPQMVRVIAIDDDEVEGADCGSLEHKAESTDKRFSSTNGEVAVLPAELAVEVVDNDGGFVYTFGELVERDMLPTMRQLRKNVPSLLENVTSVKTGGAAVPPVPEAAAAPTSAHTADEQGEQEAGQDDAPKQSKPAAGNGGHAYASSSTLEECVRAISCGEDHMGVVLGDGRVLMLGKNSDGQLGLGDFRGRSSFFQWSGIDRDGALRSKIMQIACGSLHTALLSDDGRLLMAGNSATGQLGLCDGGSLNCKECLEMQRQEDEDRQAARKAAFESHLQMTPYGQQQDQQQDHQQQQQQAEQPQQRRRRASNGLTKKQQKEIELKIYGESGGAAGMGMATKSSKSKHGGRGSSKNKRDSCATGALESSQMCAVPRVVESLRHLYVERVACGDQHTVILASTGTSGTARGTVRCRIFGWGDNSCGALGAEASTVQKHPIELRAMSQLDPFQISCGGRHTAVLCGIGRLFTSGWGLGGCLGRHAAEDSSELSDFCEVFLPANQAGKPPKDGATTHHDGTGRNKRLFVDISSGYGHLGVLADDQQLYVCGDNECGQLGLGDKALRVRLSKVGFFEGQAVSTIAFGRFHSTAATSDGLYVWGSNDSGQLGLGAQHMGHCVPVLHGGITEEVKQVHAGSKFSAVILRKAIQRSAPAAWDRKEKQYKLRADDFWKRKRATDRRRQQRRLVDFNGDEHTRNGVRGPSRVVRRTRKVDAALIRRVAAYCPYETVTNFTPRITASGKRAQRPATTNPAATRPKPTAHKGRKLVVTPAARVAHLSTAAKSPYSNQEHGAGRAITSAAGSITAEEMLERCGLGSSLPSGAKKPHAGKAKPAQNRKKRTSLVESVLLKGKR